MSGIGTALHTSLEDVSATMESTPLNLLLFSVDGVFYGVDSDQIAGVAAYKGDKDNDSFWFHKEIGHDNRSVSYHSPAVVSIKNGNQEPYRVIIDQMEDITEFSHEDISLLPELLEPFFLPKGIWGVLLRNGTMTFLLDFMPLLRAKKTDDI